MIKEILETKVNGDAIRENEKMSQHTTFRIGGCADFFVEPETEEELIGLLCVCENKGIPYFLLGRGSNLLVSDAGYRGVILSTKKLDSFQIWSEDQTHFLKAMCGISLTKLANVAADAGLSGLTFAGGIPGTLGGAVTMNAGAYGGEIAQVIQSAKVWDIERGVRELSREELKLSYRHSIIQDEKLVLLEATFQLLSAAPEKLHQEMKVLNGRRKEKQPLEYGSAGSTFKRPAGYFAGKLIEDAGLRGYRVGDVMISEKHCGFVVNVGKGSCDDALAVISHTQKIVFEKYGVMLEPEVYILQNDL